MPDGIIGERIQSFIELFNDDGHARFAAFLEDELTEGFRNLAPDDEH